MKILIFFIDALPYDLFQILHMREDTLIHSILSKENCLPLKSILGFSESIRSSIFSGTRPSTHKNWGTFTFDPKNTSFSFLKSFYFIDYLPFSLLRRTSKFMVSKLFCPKEAKKRGYDNLSTRNMPYVLLPFFNYVPKFDIVTTNSLDPIPTFFDILSSEGYRFLYLEWHKIGPFIFNKLKKEGKSSDVIVIYFDQLDMSAHRYGLWSKRNIESINDISKIYIKILKIMKEVWGDYSCITFSDHGMTQIKQYLSINEVLGGLRNLSKDLIILKGSTYIRLWLQNESVKEIVINELNKSPYGSILSNVEKNNMGILFNKRNFFDELFLINPGFEIFPNDYGWLKHKSMHGYDPSHRSQRGVFEMNFDNYHLKKINELNVIDITPTLLDLMKLKTPISCEGVSILK